jgi:hypothetical protein
MELPILENISMRTAILPMIISATVALSGCQFYFGGDDDCLWGEGDSNGAATGVRNPDTGQCEYWGSSDDWCDPACGVPCTDSHGAAEPWPSWGYCISTCTGLDEMSCQAASHCRAAYIEQCPGAPTAACDLMTERSFHECWSLDMSGPIQGNCAGLDAWQCSQHNDCSAIHSDACADGYQDRVDPDPGCLGNFYACVAEPTGCYDDYGCADGYRCNADEICLTAPDCIDANGDGLVDCGEVCYGFCVPDDNPVDPGNCYGEVSCDALAPDCPADSLPGILDGCYTGECIALLECEEPPPACATLADEASCVARTDCTPLYEGIDCICDEAGCVCAEWLFTSCI